MSPRRRKLVRVQVEVSPGVWQDSGALVTTEWVARINDQARAEGESDHDIVRIHPEAAAERPSGITFPTTPESVRWLTGLPR